MPSRISRHVTPPRAAPLYCAGVYHDDSRTPMAYIHAAAAEHDGEIIAQSVRHDALITSPMISFRLPARAAALAGSTDGLRYFQNISPARVRR